MTAPTVMPRSGPVAQQMSLPLGVSRPVSAVVIGASAGGVEALGLLLPVLPAGLSAPVFVVMHLSRDRPSLLADLFAQRCAVPVLEAEDKQPVRAGHVYFAPPDYHLLIDTAPDGSPLLSLSVDEPVHFSRPSIDVLFESAADVYGAGLLGVVLTGANADGAEGLATICAAGGQAVVQSPGSAPSPQMPEAALQRNPDALVLPPDGLVELFRSLAGRGT